MPTQLAEQFQDREGSQVAAAAPSPVDGAEAIEQPTKPERLAYSVQEAAHLLGVNYFSVYRLVQRGKLKVSRFAGDRGSLGLRRNLFFSRPAPRVVMVWISLRQGKALPGGRGRCYLAGGPVLGTLRLS